MRPSYIVHALSSDNQRNDLDIYECRMLRSRKGTYLLAGIHVLKEAMKAGMVTVNPPGLPIDQNYVRYNHSQKG